MSKIFIRIFLATFIISLFVQILPKNTYAQNINVQCTGKFSNYVQSANFPDTAALGEPFTVTVTFNSVADTSFNYSVKATQLGTALGPIPINIGNADIKSGEQRITSPIQTIIFSMPASNSDRIGAFRVTLMHGEGLGQDPVCELGTINFFDKALNETTCNLKMPNNAQQDQPFSFTLEKTDKPDIKQVVYFYRKQNSDLSKLPKGLAYVEMAVDLPPIHNFAPDGRVYDSGELGLNPPGTGSISMSFSNIGGQRLNGGDYMAVVEARKYLGKAAVINLVPFSGVPSKLANKWFVFYCGFHPFRVSSDSTSAPTDSSPITVPGTGGTIGGGELKTETCLERARKGESGKCTEGGGDLCTTDPKSPGIKTAIGCIHTNPAEFIKDVLKFATGIVGGLAFLLMLFGVFQMITSAGNPQTLKDGQERFTSAVIGLLIVVFSVLLLQIIGVDILNIPGFRPTP